MKKTKTSFQCPECSYWTLREGNRKRISHSQVYARQWKCPCGYRTETNPDRTETNPEE
jgi:C4-type Zn-finger protein